MADYAKFQALATRLIADKGMPMRFLHVTETGDSFDPDTGKYLVRTEESEVMGVLTRPTGKELGAGLFQGISTVALVAGKSLVKADLTDMLRFSGHDWEIREIVRIAPAGATIQLADDGADAYTPGALIQNKTRKDDNNGAGYRVLEVNDVLDTITISPAPSGWEADDIIRPWLPKGARIGTAIESRFANVEIDGISGKMAEGGLTIGTPVTNLEEIGDEYVSEGVSTTRSITLERSINFRTKDAREFGKGYRGYELPVTVFAGKYPCMTLAHYMPRVKFNTPEINESDTVVTMQQNGTALGVKGEDALFIIQE